VTLINAIVNRIDSVSTNPIVLTLGAAMVETCGNAADIDNCLLAIAEIAVTLWAAGRDGKIDRREVYVTAATALLACAQSWPF
jgi:hypothetical protein